jgi:hypothetical protein
MKNKIIGARLFHETREIVEIEGVDIMEQYFYVSTTLIALGNLQTP